MSHIRLSWRLLSPAFGSQRLSCSGSVRRCAFSTASVHAAARSRRRTTDTTDAAAPIGGPSTEPKTKGRKRTKATDVEAALDSQPLPRRTRSPKPKACVELSPSPEDSTSPPPPTIATATTTSAQSSVARGTDFENLCISVLGGLFKMELERCGGAGDKGIDLKGWWEVPTADSASVEDASAAVGRATGARGRVRVVAQCKCQDVGGKKIGPVIVREVEGVLHRAYSSARSPPPSASTGVGSPSATLEAEEPPPPVVGIILSSSGFSKQALMQAMSSMFPMMLMHVEQAGPEGAAGAVLTAASRCHAVVWNDAVGGSRGLLGGRIEVKWQRSLVAGQRDRPALFYDGKRLAV